MRALIRSNLLRVVVLVWFAGWLLMVMPGHKRGIVTLPGSEAAAQQASCCEPTPDCCQPTAPAPDASCCTLDAGTDPSRPIDPAKHCAICFLKAHLTDPPPVTFYTPFLGELDELDYEVEPSLTASLAAPERSRGRAPPRV